MVQAISNFQNQQTGYDAALRAYSMVQKVVVVQLHLLTPTSADILPALPAHRRQPPAASGKGLPTGSFTPCTLIPSSATWPSATAP
jgi:hypothetical protein